MGLWPVEGSTPSSSIFHAGVAQTADAPSSEGGSCEFESHLPHQIFRTRARSPNRQRRLSQKESSAGSTPAARIPFARVAQSGRGSGLKHRRLRVRISPRAFKIPRGGVCKRTKRLDFQSSARSGFAGSSPATPARSFTLVVAQKGRAPRRDRGRCGFESRRPTFTSTGR